MSGKRRGVGREEILEGGGGLQVHLFVPALLSLIQHYMMLYVIFLRLIKLSTSVKVIQ